MSYYLIKTRFGLQDVSSNGDGYSIKLRWYRAFPNDTTNEIAYAIYWDSDQDNVLNTIPKYISYDDKTEYDFKDFEPGNLYFFNIRPIEYNSLNSNLSTLIDIGDGLKVLPSSVLTEDIDESQLTIPIESIDNFPAYGSVQIGYELIEYDSITGNDLNATIRGAGNTYATYHTIDGYDGYEYLNPEVLLYIGEFDRSFDKVMMCQSRFEYFKYAYRDGYGYKQQEEDILNTDLSVNEELNEDFPYLSYTGWRRRDPVKLFAGDCVGSYIGGYQFCADGYDGVGRMLRPISFNDANNQRQEALLEIDGEPVVLLSLQTTGIRCSCFQPSSEYPDDRCIKCFGRGFVLSYNQYFNPRRSDGRIMVRISPFDEDIKMYDTGLESEVITDAWTLTIPTIKDRDIIIRYDIADNEEYRYEVLSVNRQRTVLRQTGGQKMRIQRIRKTDIAYQIPVFKNTELIPEDLELSLESADGLIPHTHSIRINEKSQDLFTQITSKSQGHSHQVKYNQNTGQLEVLPVLGHTHYIV